MIETLIFLAVFLTVVAWFIYSLVRRGLDLKKLAAEGTTATGKIVAKEYRKVGKRRRSPILTYEFQDAFGALHRRTIHVATTVYEAHQPGGPIAVVYLPDRPQTNAARYMVDQIRGVAH